MQRSYGSMHERFSRTMQWLKKLMFNSSTQLNSSLICACLLNFATYRIYSNSSRGYYLYLIVATRKS